MSDYFKETLNPDTKTVRNTDKFRAFMYNELFIKSKLAELLAKLPRPCVVDVQITGRHLLQVVVYGSPTGAAMPFPFKPQRDKGPDHPFARATYELYQDKYSVGFRYVEPVDYWVSKVNKPKEIMAIQTPVEVLIPDYVNIPALH